MHGARLLSVGPIGSKASVFASAHLLFIATSTHIDRTTSTKIACKPPASNGKPTASQVASRQRQVADASRPLDSSGLVGVVNGSAMEKLVQCARCCRAHLLHQSCRLNLDESAHQIRDVSLPLMIGSAACVHSATTPLRLRRLGSYIADDAHGSTILPASS